MSPSESNTYPPNFLLSVVIPVFNEAQTVEEVVRRVRGTGIPAEIILVDDGSDDGTAEIVDSLSQDGDVRLVRHATNLGKGAAVKSGSLVAQGTCLLIQDADLEYDPQDYHALMAPIIEDRADAVYGSRFRDQTQASDPRWHRWGNQVITWLSNKSTGLHLTDVETCYKLLRAETALDILRSLRETGFGIEIEITSALARRGARIVEVPIKYAGRSYAEGKKIGLIDGLRALWCIVRY